MSPERLGGIEQIAAHAGQSPYRPIMQELLVALRETQRELERERLRSRTLRALAQIFQWRFEETRRRRAA